MSRTYDLGRAHFQADKSPLQLQLTATGDFIWSIGSSNNSSRVVNIQRTQLFATWVTEAPEIELRFHVEIDPNQVWPLSRLVSTLGEKICGSKVSTGGKNSLVLSNNHLRVRFGPTLASQSSSRAAKPLREGMIFYLRPA